MATRWIAIDPMDRYSIPGRPACYVVFLDGSVTYVGQSTNLKSRFSTYAIRLGYGAGVLTPWGAAGSIEVKVNFGTQYGDWAMRELRLIRRLKPPGNCLGSTKQKGTGPRDASPYSEKYYVRRQIETASVSDVHG